MTRKEIENKIKNHPIGKPTWLTGAWLMRFALSRKSEFPNGLNECVSWRQNMMKLLNERINPVSRETQ